MVVEIASSVCDWSNQQRTGPGAPASSSDLSLCSRSNLRPQTNGSLLTRIRSWLIAAKVDNAPLGLLDSWNMVSFISRLVGRHGCHRSGRVLDPGSETHLYLGQRWLRPLTANLCDLGWLFSAGTCVICDRACSSGRSSHQRQCSANRQVFGWLKRLVKRTQHHE